MGPPNVVSGEPWRDISSLLLPIACPAHVVLLVPHSAAA